MFDNEMRKKLINSIHESSKPIDFDSLFRRGLLVKKGRSYYAPHIQALPDNVSDRIVEIAHTKHGTRVTFAKETKSLKKLSEKLKRKLG